LGASLDSAQSAAESLATALANARDDWDIAVSALRKHQESVLADTPEDQKIVVYYCNTCGSTLGTGPCNAENQESDRKTIPTTKKALECLKTQPGIGFKEPGFLEKYYGVHNNVRINAYKIAPPGITLQDHCNVIRVFKQNLPESYRNSIAWSIDCLENTDNRHKDMQALIIAWVSYCTLTAGTTPKKSGRTSSTNVKLNIGKKKYKAFTDIPSLKSEDDEHEDEDEEEEESKIGEAGIDQLNPKSQIKYKKLEPLKGLIGKDISTELLKQTTEDKFLNNTEAEFSLLYINPTNKEEHIDKILKWREDNKQNVHIYYSRKLIKTPLSNKEKTHDIPYDKINEKHIESIKEPVLILIDKSKILKSYNCLDYIKYMPELFPWKKELPKTTDELSNPPP
jgi:hypothetical protein